MRVNAEPVVVRGFRFSGVSAGMQKGRRREGPRPHRRRCARHRDRAFQRQSRQGGAGLRHDGSHPRAGGCRRWSPTPDAPTASPASPGIKLAKDSCVRDGEGNRLRCRIDRAVVDRRHRASFRFGRIRAPACVEAAKELRRRRHGRFRARHHDDRYASENRLGDDAHRAAPR